MNVLTGERYKMIPKESHKLAKGEFGQTVRPMNEEIRTKILAGEEPITCRPADLIAPQLPQYEQDVAKWKRQDEDTLSYALFPNVAKEFFEYRDTQDTGIDPSKYKDGAYPV